MEKFRKKMEEALAKKYGDKVRVELIDESDNLAGFGLEIAQGVDSEEVQAFVDEIVQSMGERSPAKDTEIEAYLKQLDEAEEELESYSKLKEGWAGYTSPPTHAMSLAWALELLEACRRNCHMLMEFSSCPHPDGGVSVDLIVGDRELSITASYKEPGLALVPEGDEDEDEDEEDEEDWSFEPGLSLVATTSLEEVVIEDETPILDNLELQNKWIRWLVSEKVCGCGDR